MWRLRQPEISQPAGDDPVRRDNWTESHPIAFLPLGAVRPGPHAPCRPRSSRSRGHRGRWPGAVLGCSMIEKDEILAALCAALPGLKQRWPIGSLAIFGSVARGNATSRSDLDLVTRDALKPHIGSRVLEEAVRL